MTDRGLEGLVADWLADRAPTAAPPALHPAVIERVRHTRQRRVGWGGTWVLPAAAAVAALVLTALIAAALIGGSRPPAPDGPRASTDTFLVPFSYSSTAAA